MTTVLPPGWGDPTIERKPAPWNIPPEQYSNNDHLNIACRKGDTDEVDRLIAEGVNLNGVDRWGNSALMRAANAGHTDLVAKLISSGANVNQLATRDQWTALMNGACEGFTDCCKLLIEAGAELDARNSMSATAFMYANYYGAKECQAYLEGLGCDTNVTWLGAQWASHPDKMWDEDESPPGPAPSEEAPAPSGGEAPTPDP